MDPALHLQHRIAQGISEVSFSIRNSFSSLVLAASSNGSASTNNPATPANTAMTTTPANPTHGPGSPGGGTGAGGNGGGTASSSTSASTSTSIPMPISTTTLDSTAGHGEGSGSSTSSGADVDLEKGVPELERARHGLGSHGDEVQPATASHINGGPSPNDPEKKHGQTQEPGQEQDAQAERGRLETHVQQRQQEEQEKAAEAAAAARDAEAEAEAAARLQRPPLTLQTLPPELLMLIVHNLNFGDIERLRRTNHFFRDFAAPRTVRTLFGRDTLRRMLLSHCASCLKYDEFKSTLLLASASHRNYPLCARCVTCAVTARDDRLVVGRKVTMGNGDGVWVCRWCGWPVTLDAAPGHVQFHRDCYGSYNDTLLFFFLLGWVQLSLGIVAGALAWTYFRGEVLVFAPTVTSFLLLWVCFFMLMFRGNRVRTYHWTLLVELIVLCLWIPPIYFIVPMFIQTPYYELPRSTMACLIIFCFNIFFRLLNVMGNIVLMCEYQRTKHYLPKGMIPFWRRVTNPLADVLIFWTYPQSVEQKYPPHWS